MSRLRLLCCGVALLVSASVVAEVIELEGTVKSVDAATRVITIERKTPSGTKILELEVAKKAGELGSVKAGDRIKFGYDSNLEIVTKLGVGSQAGSGAAATDLRGRSERKPGRREQEICREVVRKLETDHYLQPQIDDEIC